MQKQTKGLQRNTIDKYYTKPQIVEFCINQIKHHVSFLPEDFIIEPSAGNGSFIHPIRQLSKNYHFYDIEPEHPDIVKQDFLQLQPNSISSNIHIIGNPPFGRQSSLTIQFIKKASIFAETISFILPKSFKKQSLQKSFPPLFHLLFETDLPEKSFLVNGIEHDVPCIFQIWKKKDFPRLTVETMEPIGFRFVQKTDNPHISCRRVGVYAGKIDSEFLSKSEQSHYFIQFTNGKSIEDNIALLKHLEFPHNNTVGPRSISKPELIREINKKMSIHIL